MISPASNDENNNDTSEFWSDKANKVNENKTANRIKKCFICDENVQTVQKVKHGSGSVYKCPAEGCFFSCQKSLTELLDHIKVAKHFRAPEEIITTRKWQENQNITRTIDHAFQISAPLPVQVPDKISDPILARKQNTIQNSNEINQKPKTTKNQLQNPFQDENGQMYYK